MEANDYFSTIRDFYKTKAFCDLKIVAVINSAIHPEETPEYASVFCHSLVLFSAIPELRFCIRPNQENDEEFLNETKCFSPTRAQNP